MKKCQTVRKSATFTSKIAFHIIEKNSPRIIVLNCRKYRHPCFATKTLKVACYTVSGEHLQSVQSYLNFADSVTK